MFNSQVCHMEDVKKGKRHASSIEYHESMKQTYVNAYKSSKTFNRWMELLKILGEQIIAHWQMCTHDMIIISMKEECKY